MPLFKIRELDVSFNSIPILKRLSFSLSNHGLILISGKSGSGKSTLLNILYGTEKATTGTVKFAGKEINKMSEKLFARYHSYDVAMVFQHYNLFESLTSLENTILPLLIRGEKRSSAITKAEYFFNLFNIKNLENQIVSTLSGGEKQRVAIIRALIISPKVILCDEPTGALDKKNSKEIVSILKEISKDILVVVVSHNKELMAPISDRIITLEDGTIKEDISINKLVDKAKPYIAIQKIKKSWNKLFIKKNFKENIGNNVLSIISSTFGFLGIMLSFGFINGTNLSKEEALNNNYASSYATASLKTFYKIENSPLSFEKRVRPTYDDFPIELKEIDSLIYEPNFDYVFSPTPFAKCSGKELSSFQMIPLYDLSFANNLKIKANDISYELADVVINEEMRNLIGKSQEDIIDENIIISSESTIKTPTGDLNNPFVKDEISYSLRLRVVGVVQEFNFLNTPKIYYSFPDLAEYLKGITLTNLSYLKGTYVNVYDYVASIKDDDPISSYCYNLFILNEHDRNEFFNVVSSLAKSDSSFQIDSTPYDIKESYTSFMDSFSNALLLLVLISYIGINFIIGMLSFSLFITHKKEAAILTCLGARYKSIKGIYIRQNLILLITSFLTSLALVYPCECLLNTIFKNTFGISSLVKVPFLSYLSIPFLIPTGLLIVAILVSIIFTIIPLQFYKHISLTNELRDE